jgi:hypothetical protein
VGCATGVSEARSHQRRGKRTPTLVTRNFGREANGARVPALHVDPPKRSSDGVNHPVPQFHRAEPKSPWGVPATKVARGAGNTRGAGARRSFGWQTSIGRIACLLHREVARPVGGEGALAGRKSVAPFDAGRGWVEGESVRMHGRQTSLPCMIYGFRLVGSRYDGRRPRAFARLALTSRATQSPRFAGQLPFTIREERDEGQHIGRDSDPDSGVPADDNGTSEVDTIR